MWPLVGRDIVETKIGDRSGFEMREQLFEPDEVILAEGEVGKQVHLVVEGTVAVRRRLPSGETVEAEVGPGGHFGHTLRDGRHREEVRARTAVRAIAVRHDQVARLQRVLTPLHGLETGSAPLEEKV